MRTVKIIRVIAVTMYIAMLLLVVSVNAKTAPTINLKSVASVKLSGEVDATSIGKVIDFLEKSKSKTVYILIDSGGGNVIDGHALINYIKTSNKTIHTVCMKTCGSMAAYIHNAGKIRYMVKSAELFYHSVSISVSGDIEGVTAASISGLIEYMILNNDVALKMKLPLGLATRMITATITADLEKALSLKLADSALVVE